MATIITKKIKALERVQRELPRIILEEARNHRKFIQDANKKQLEEGKRSDGTDMPDYVENSKAPSAPGLVKLFDTGEFYEGIEPLFSEDGIEVIGLDDKTGFLVGKYGQMIFGLNKDNIRELAHRMKPGVQKRIRAML